MEILSNFAVFEGLDGSGTTTQLNILKAFFHPKEVDPGQLFAAEKKSPYLSYPPVYITYEPTNGIIGKIIRAGLKKEVFLCEETMARLFAADRNEHIYGKEGIMERCKRGELVISDRYLLSSLVYQGLTCGEELPLMLNRDFPLPELLIFFDIDVKTAQNRINSRGQPEKYENLDFQAKVLERYKSYLPQFAQKGVRIEVVDSSKPIEEVSLEVRNILEKMPIFKG